jgi:hypothetical protein
VTAAIDALIATSSIGAGLANIRENGIDAEIADLEAEPAPKKRKAKAKSPTSRTLDECKRRGWTAGVVERHIPFPRPQGTKIDLFGVIDLIAIRSALHGGRPGILGIQATSGTNHASRRTKILAEGRVREWVEAGGQIELWSWSPRGVAGKAKRWAVRVETYAEMVASAGSPT